MTTEEKLVHFQQDAMLTARERSSRELDTYTESLNKLYEEHCAKARLLAENQVKLSREALHREHNRQLSKKQLETRRQLTITKDAISEEIFTRVMEMINEYKASPAYFDALLNCVEKAKRTAGKQQLVIYIDESDSALADTLSEKTGLPVKISEDELIGGIEAVIPARHILIDMSFSTKLREKKTNLRLGGEDNE